MILGVVLAPTDAALGQAVVTEPRVPGTIRQGLNAAKLAEIRGYSALRQSCGSTGDEIQSDILEHGVRDGVLRPHYETVAIDASTLVAALVGFRLPAGRRRSSATEHPGDRRRPWPGPASSCAVAPT